MATINHYNTRWVNVQMITPIFDFLKQTNLWAIYEPRYPDFSGGQKYFCTIKASAPAAPITRGCNPLLIWPQWQTLQDYCNALYVRLPLECAWKFQQVKNRATRLLTITLKHLTTIFRLPFWSKEKLTIMFVIAAGVGRIKAH